MLTNFAPAKAALALTAASLLLACGGGDQGNASADFEQDLFISTAVPSAGLTEFEYGGLDPEEIGLTSAWSRITSRDARADLGAARLTGVQTQQSDGFDRVVFSLEPHMSGYRLTVTNDAGSGCDGSGELAEATTLVVEFDGAQADEATIQAEDAELGYPALTSATQTCNEDDTVRWLFGLADEVEHRIIEMRGELRLVVDIRHPEAD